MKKKPDPIPTTHSEADRFIDFARKLMAVPKSEIDQKQAEYQKKKIAERKKATRPPNTGKIR